MTRHCTPNSVGAVIMAAIVSLASACSPKQGEVLAAIPIGDEEGALGLTDGGYEQLRVCPGPMAIADDGSLHILDRVKDRVLVYDLDEGAVRQTIALDPNGVLQTLIVTDGATYVWARGAEGSVEIRQVAGGSADAGGFGSPQPSEAVYDAFDESGLSDDAGGAGALGSAPTAFAEQWSRAYSDGDDSFRVSFSLSADRRDAIVSIETMEPLRYRAARPILGVSTLRIDREEGRAAFLFTEEPGVARAVVFERARTKPRIFIVPYEASLCGPEGGVAATPSGDILFLSITLENALVLRLVARSAFDSISGEQASDPMRDKGREQYEQLEELQGETSEAAGFASAAVDRDSMMATAKAYLDHEMSVSTENYQPTVKGICYRFANKCTDNCNAWKRPRYLEAAHAVEEAPGDLKVKGVPYAWGGFDSLDEIDEKLALGRPAGNACTRTVLLDGGFDPNDRFAAGVDCSGLVSRAWALSRKLSTEDLVKKEHAVLIDWADLKPGDVVVKKGKHVRLFESWSGSASTTIEVIEAATSVCGDSVCRNSYTIAKLAADKYLPYRNAGLAKAEQTVP
jgi:hypothetical protein